MKWFRPKFTVIESAEGETTFPSIKDDPEAEKRLQDLLTALPATQREGK